MPAPSFRPCVRSAVLPFGLFLVATGALAGAGFVHLPGFARAERAGGTRLSPVSSTRAKPARALPAASGLPGVAAGSTSWLERWIPSRLRAKWRDAGARPYGEAASEPATTAPPPPAPTPGAEPSSRPQLAGILLDVSYVDRSSTAFARFRTSVDNAVAGRPTYGFEATDAAMMYLLSGGLQYCDLAVRMVEQQVADAEARIASGQNPAVAGDSYLEVGDKISDLALTLDVCAFRTTAQQQQRWLAYAQQAVWNVWNPSQASWGGRSAPWSGWSITNPGNNYHYSFLTATAYLGLTFGRNPTWLNFLDTQKWPALRSYYAGLPGGGSREGTGYGTAQMRLFTLYRVWRDATGVDLGNASSHLTDTIHYWTHATVPTLNRFAPFGDQSRNSNPELFDYHRRLMLEARANTTDTRAKEIASWWLNNISVRQMSSAFNYRHDLLPAGTGGAPPTDLTYHATGTGHLFSRTGWDTGAMWVAFSAGPYVESHAHQDQGAFTLFAGDWLAVTSNIWSHSGIEQSTDMHNLVRFERSGSIVPQREGTTSSMTVTRGAGGAFTANANLTPAYGTSSPPVSSWTRQLQFGNRRLVVTDSFALNSGVTAIHQTHSPTAPTINASTREVTTQRMRMRVLSPANATISSVGVQGRYRIEVRGGTTGYQVEYSQL